MPTRATTVAVAIASCAALLTVATGCASGAESPETSRSPVSSSPPAGPTGTPVRFDATLTSSYSEISEVGTKDAQLFGVNVLSGTTTINDRSVRVKMVATLDSNDGSGPLGGFLSMTWSDGTTLGMRQSGTVEVSSGGKEFDYKSDLTVVGGSDDARGTTGTGTLTGTRKSGSTTAKIDVTLFLSGAPEMITGEPAGPKTPSQSYAATIEP